MRNLILGLALSVAFIVGCVAGPALLPRTSAAPAPGTPKWEYKCFDDYTAKDVEPKANVLGRQGWEMTGKQQMNCLEILQKCFPKQKVGLRE